MARLTKQTVRAGQPTKPAHLSARAAAEWDRLMTELAESGIQVAPAHRALISQAATIAADITEAWDELEPK